MTEYSLFGTQIFNDECEENKFSPIYSYHESNWIQKSIQFLNLKTVPSDGLYVIVTNEFDSDTTEVASSESGQKFLSDQLAEEFNQWRNAFSESLFDFEKNLKD
jgi:hypothetical protein